ncbi:MAG: hypothetical protein V1798_00615 [Pseudomonadota bacterium]
MRIKAFALLALGVLAAGCGRSPGLDSIVGQSRPYALRMRQIAAYAMTPQQAAQEEQLRDNLTGEPWIGLNEDGNPLPDVTLVIYSPIYHPDKGLYSYTLDLTRSDILWHGITHPTRTVDGAIRGFFSSSGRPSGARTCINPWAQPLAVHAIPTMGGSLDRYAFLYGSHRGIRGAAARRCYRDNSFELEGAQFEIRAEIPAVPGILELTTIEPHLDIRGMDIAHLDFKPASTLDGDSSSD